MDKCKKSYIEWINNIPLFYCGGSRELCPYGRYCVNELIPKMGGNYVNCVELNKVEIVEDIGIEEETKESIVKTSKKKSEIVIEE